MEKIKMPHPIAELDGDEMTHVLWGKIKEQLILPFVELNTEYYDLGLPNRERTADEVLPWDHISPGVAKSHLLREYACAQKSQISPDCRVKCTGCGASKLLKGGVCDA